MLGLLSQSLKDETMAINPWTISSAGGGGVGGWRGGGGQGDLC